MSDKFIQDIYQSQPKEFFEDLHELLKECFEITHLADFDNEIQMKCYQDTLKRIMDRRLIPAMTKVIDKDVQKRMAKILVEGGIEAWEKDKGECLADINHLPRSWTPDKNVLKDIFKRAKRHLQVVRSSDKS